MQTSPGTLSAPPPLATVPAGRTERPILIRHETLEPLAPDADGRVHSDGTYETTVDVLGVPHIFIDGIDVTYWEDTPTQIGEWSCSQPGGEEYASVEFPWLTPMHVPGTGSLTWLRPDAPVQIAIVQEDGTRLHQFSGYLVSDTTGNDESTIYYEWHIQGLLNEADLVDNKVPIFLDPTDVGALIPRALNAVPSRSYGTIAEFSSGILSRQRGSYQDSVLDQCQAWLSTAWTAAGDQLTIKRTGTPGNYALGWKDKTTVHWTVTAGARGVWVDLTSDKSETHNVIRGRGVGPGGESWAGWCYPNLLPDDAPIYPNGDLRLITSGTTDAGTDSGTGVSDWQRRVNSIGYSVAVDGNYGSADVLVARRIQTDYGLTIDGILGPQTWAASFDVGSHGGDLSGAYRRPLAIESAAEPFLYAANGAIIGSNPDYRGVKQRVLPIDYGTNITKAEATASAQLQLPREMDPGWTGTITLKTDPAEGSKFLINEGQNILLRGFRGTNHLLHIVSARFSLDDMTVTLTVDSKYRDAMTVASVMQRDRESKADQGRRPGNVNRRSRQEQDMATQFDWEAGGGVIPRHAVFGNLWTVIRIPVSEVGRIAKITYRGGADFCFALFAKPILPSNMHVLVGNPHTSTSPYEDNMATLEDDFGFIEAWGMSGDVGGYYPKSKTTGPFTGDFKDTGGVEYNSSRGVWVWVAEIASASTFLEGRLYPAPVQ